MLVSQIPITTSSPHWKHTSEGIWHKQYPNKACRNGYEWKKYFELTCKSCKSLFVSVQKNKAQYCSYTCGNNAIKKFGKEQNRYKGYKCHTKAGYVLVRISAKPYKYTGEHKYKMEQKLGRKLNASEVVHHINYVKSDNRIENLLLLTRVEHIKIHPPFNRGRRSSKSPEFEMSKS